MDLNELREQINDCDRQLAEIFVKRMEICRQVAEYKIENKLPVFQNTREAQVIDRVKSLTPSELQNSAQVLFTTIMDISKCRQYNEFFSENSEIAFERFSNDIKVKIACQGTSGAYSEQAAHNIFSDCSIEFFKTFEEVFQTVSNGETDFGIIPVRNSSAGTVIQAYELMKKYDFHIAASTCVKISHCLAVKKGVSESEITTVYSHEQALSQCSEFLKANGLKPEPYLNTALSAELVSKSDSPIGAICSVECAKLFDLDILRTDIANSQENYTKFILISKKIYSSEKANIVSVAMSLPHTASALYRLLTKFSVAGLNLLGIESRPIATRDFDVLFYLDFEGSISSKDVAVLIKELESELAYFKFLGNYYEI